MKGRVASGSDDEIKVFFLIVEGGLENKFNVN